MAIADKVRAVLALEGKKNTELAAFFGMTPQSMNNKLSRDSFSAKDLIKVADFVGGRIAIVLSNGQMIYLDPEREPGPDE